VRIIAVIPVKPASQGKQRLATVLDATLRRRLVGAMLECVLGAALGARGLAGVGILTTDRSLVPAGIEQLTDPGTGLNAALAATASVLTARGVEAMLVLPGDLPFIVAADVDALLELARPDRVVVVPDARGAGTNALLLAPPRVLLPQFGPGSLSAHLTAASAAGADCRVSVCARIGRDIDEPCDLAPLLAEAPGRFGFLRFTAEARCG
jgi:2-phospho-L-lactate/phosphoenolpyruvate guanylyltransferase